MSRSLFGRLLLTLLGSVLLLWITAIAMAVYRADREIGEIHDRQLSQTAQVLLALAGHEIVEHMEEAGTRSVAPVEGVPLAELGRHLEKYAPEDGLAFHVEASGADFHFRSANFPIELDRMARTSGYVDVDAGGMRWRVYTGHDESGVVTVQVAQRDVERQRLAVDMTHEFVPPLLLGLVITVFVTVLQVRRAQRPLVELATALESRGPDSLEHLEVERPAREIAPIAAALNHLIDELRGRIERERRFIADAAHELRTPLASIHTDAEMALELDGDAQRETLLGLRAGANRAARLVGQLMTLARLDPLSTLGEGTQFDLGACTQAVMAELAAAADRKGIEIALEERASGRIRGHQALVDVLVRNLVENAIRYVPTGGVVQVIVEEFEGATVLRVEDSGPGIPPGSRERVFERFYRGTDGTSMGSGLGLSISARIAALHGARIELGDSALGGLCATVRFPPLTATQPEAVAAVRMENAHA